MRNPRSSTLVLFKEVRLVFWNENTLLKIIKKCAFIAYGIFFDWWKRKIRRMYFTKWWKYKRQVKFCKIEFHKIYIYLSCITKTIFPTKLFYLYNCLFLLAITQMFKIIFNKISLLLQKQFFRILFIKSNSKAFGNYFHCEELFYEDFYIWVWDIFFMDL